MIKEIPEPYETIYEFLARKKSAEKVRKKYNIKLSEYDVEFKEDNTIIQEFALRSGLHYKTAEKIGRIFFEEIKRALISGKSVQIQNFGLFYTTWVSTIEIDGKKVSGIPDHKSCVNIPRLRAFFGMKKYVKNNNEIGFKDEMDRRKREKANNTK